MPVSTETHSGFSISKWELKYLRCRYMAHRNKIAAAKPAIDAQSPPERPHVRYKKKKALQEERRQIRIIQENLRILDRTMNIMVSSSMPTHFSKGRPFACSSEVLQTQTSTRSSSLPQNQITKTTEETTNEGGSASTSSSFSLSAKAGKRLERPLTTRLKRNTHIIFRWFIQRFGRYVPWWAEINY